MVVRPSKGGAFGHVARLSGALIAAGHTVALAGPHGERATAVGAELIDLDIGREISPGEDARAVPALARAIRAFDADLVHAHGSKGGVIARLARVRNPRIPLVFTPHNFAFTNYFTSRAKRASYRAIEQALVPLTSRYLCVCEAERRIACRIAPPRLTRVVYNGIEEFRAIGTDPSLERLRGSGPVISAVTELQPPKGIETLVEAMPRILAAIPAATLVIAGDGWLRQRITAQIERLGMGERVVLLGEVADVTTVYGVSDVYVLPGWSESFPYALLEAMSLGQPIVATDVGGVGEAIEDGKTGRLVTPHDADGLADAVIDLLRNRDLAARLGRDAQKRMRERFAFDQMFAGTLTVYKELGFR